MSVSHYGQDILLMFYQNLVRKQDNEMEALTLHHTKAFQCNEF